LEDEWNEVGKMYELFSIGEIGVPLTPANGACVKELGKRNRKEKVLEKVKKYWSRLLEKDETNPLGKTINSKKMRGTNWMSRITQKLERLGMGDIWKNGRNNKKEVWIRMRGRCVAIKSKILRLQSEKEH
jgi:hypothetical protein